MGLSRSASEGAIKDPRMAKLKKQWDQSGASFFRNSHVQSSPGFFMQSGVCLALPLKTLKPVQKPDAKMPVSEYAGKFTEKRYCYSSMDNKPLCPYEPLAYRSRNAEADLQIPYKNSSIVKFDQGLHVMKKRQYHTTNGMNYTGEPCETRTNPGILAEKYKIMTTDRAK